MDSVKQIVNAMTVDVEDYFHVSALSQSIPRSSWDSIEPRVEQNTNRIMDLFDEHGVSATFFVLGWVAERFPGIVRDICNRGHELACHGQSHSLIYEQARDEFVAETNKSKAILEDVSGVSVNGYRAASYSIRADSSWALDVLADAGFQYDSSIVPVSHDLYGIPGAGAHPYELQLDSGASLVEFPPSTIRFAGHRIPIGGGGYFRLYPYWFTKRGLASINDKERRPFTFYLHPWEIDPEQPRVTTSWKSRFRHYNNLHKCETRLRRLLRDFQFTDKATILQSMSLRKVRLADLLAGNAAG